MSKSLLQKRAVVFEEMLYKYADTDSEVREFLRRVQPLLADAKAGSIESPHDYPFGSYFSNPDFSVLAARYWNHELSNSEAEFVSVLRGWE